MEIELHMTQIHKENIFFVTIVVNRNIQKIYVGKFMVS